MIIFSTRSVFHVSTMRTNNNNNREILRWVGMVLKKNNNNKLYFSNVSITVGGGGGGLLRYPLNTRPVVFYLFVRIPCNGAVARYDGILQTVPLPG